jgi:flagellar hook-associated protein FlgK
MNEQISDLKTIAKLTDELIDQKERDLEKMSQMIGSQHQSVMKLTKAATPAIPEQDLR